MCMFSKPIPDRHISATQIYARPLDDGRQALVYSMNLEYDDDVAMILPLPVPMGAAEDGVGFVDLSGYASLFADLHAGYPNLIFSRGRGGPSTRETLKVHAVGEFEASFVPALSEMDRLDERFRLPSSVWSALPHYADWGFCVFKLAPRQPSLIGRVPGGGARTIHPMALTFPRRDPSRLYFPTTHVHDGQVHRQAHFDHALYLQGTNGHRSPPETPRGLGAAWERAQGPAAAHVKVEKAAGLVAPAEYVWRCKLRGELPNRDLFVA